MMPPLDRQSASPDPDCGNCDGRGCMGCVLREYDHDCADNCPFCCGSDDDGGHAMLLPFDVDDPEFARGFEAGRVWEMMEHAKNAGEEFKQVAHASNAEMFVRMGERLGIEVTAEILDDTWLELTVAGWVLMDDDGAEVS